MIGSFPTEFTEEELNAWLNTLDTNWSLAIIEKLYKDFRDYSLSIMRTELRAKSN